MSLSRILNIDNAPSRLSPFPQPDPVYRDDIDMNDDRPSKRRRMADEPPPHQGDRQWQSPPSPSTDLDECTEIWQEELHKYMEETRLRAREVEQWYERESRETNTELARRFAHEYQARLAPPTEQVPPPRRPRSASIDRDILRTLNDTPPPTNGHSYPEDTPVPHHTSQGKGKRRADDDAASVRVKTENEQPQLTRKRKVDEVEDFMSDAASSVVVPPKKKGGRQKKVVQGDENAKPPRKRGPRKSKGATASAAGSKLPSEEPQQSNIPVPSLLQANRATPSVAGSIIGVSHDVTPLPSTPSSPALTAVTIQGTVPGFWPLNEPIPPLKKPKKLDHAQAAKRVFALEEAQRRVWHNIARKDVVRV
ncbi:hypothetical protein M422DRAFT_46685 [Sphaerobolus stellatus SS14]|uniref:Uncharacterized protein n=1 Tax=Sphaerobolus stellatus (strain SS14) TaxID=990650 RepID=A0A0C9VSY3_SPHS4|nr:hypothetical protein M422DRAFT_46685 [Sphaerobolus stellatus SS14]